MANKVVTFVNEAWTELQKVVWPEGKPYLSAKTELWGSTYIVIVLTFILAGFIGVIDYIITLIGAIGARFFGV